ncbi:MAG: carboxypeptidase regulatory-like domain-containing protein [Blastocatellia bacterium]
MKRAVNVLIAGCLLGTMAITPTSSDGNHSATVEASPALALITGSVKDDRGTPVAGAFVSLLEPHSRGKEIKSVKTDAKGKFSASVLPGLYRLRASAEGFVASIARVSLDRTATNKHDFSLRRTDTVVQKRGDSDDYRWIAQSAPRHAMNLHEETQGKEEVATVQPDAAIEDDFARPRPALHGPSFHGMLQLMAVSSSARPGLPPASFYGTNFAVSGTLGGNLEMAFIGQQGVGLLAPQRLAAMASIRPGANHQVTATIGYGQVAMARTPCEQGCSRSKSASRAESLDQLSVSATASWQVFRPLLVIYGFDYSRFVGRNDRESVLPRFAVQYAPTARLRMNAAITPGSDLRNDSPETFDTENIQAEFETAPAEVAFADSPLLDRSRRVEAGIEKLFGEGGTSIEASAFYDLISNHGVGVLALPLEASPENQAAFEQVAHHITAMNGAARGARLMLNHRVSDHVSASLGYSYGYGSRFNAVRPETVAPGGLFRRGFFQVASAKLDVDFSQETGTRISTVIRLSPDAVVFAIDPFAGRMSVYDPNINIYLTQELPNFGLPLRWQAIVDLRNLLDQTKGAEDGAVQLISATMRRSVRGGLAFRW